MYALKAEERQRFSHTHSDEEKRNNSTLVDTHHFVFRVYLQGDTDPKTLTIGLCGDETKISSILLKGSDGKGILQKHPIPAWVESLFEASKIGNYCAAQPREFLLHTEGEICWYEPKNIIDGYFADPSSGHRFTMSPIYRSNKTQFSLPKPSTIPNIQPQVPQKPKLNEVDEAKKELIIQSYINQLLKITEEYKNDLPAEKYAPVHAILNTLIKGLREGKKNEEAIINYCNFLEAKSESGETNRQVIEKNTHVSTARFCKGLALIILIMVTGVLPGLIVTGIACMVTKTHPLYFFKPASQNFIDQMAPASKDFVEAIKPFGK